MQRKSNSLPRNLGFVFLTLMLLGGCGDNQNQRVGSNGGDPPPVAGVVDEWSGKVVHVKDGDTIEVQRNGERVIVRLVEIDTPELAQAFGRNAKQATSDLCAGETVTVLQTGTDSYDRVLAHVILPDGRDLNRELVQQGYAWWYRHYSSDQSLGDLEADAKSNKRGLWADPNPTPPWDWRVADRENSSSTPSFVPNGVKITALLPNPYGPDEEKEQVTIGNGTDAVVDLKGWKLVDAGDNEFRLAGSIGPRTSLRITMTKTTMPLNNNGDEVQLIDAGGTVRSRVRYSEEQAGTGVTIEFRE